jgi:hypothetical protein
MARKALVIGAQTGGLSGVHNDADIMLAILGERGFTVELRREQDATQAGIREGLDRLVTDAKSDDAIVVYFSGHGNEAIVLTRNGSELPERRFIVPTDYDESSPGDFRGITSIELSVWVSRLTQRTRNVTVILDCCHAGRMVRDPDLQVKAYPHPTYLDVAEQTGMLRALGLPVDILHPVSNPYAVRIMACRPEQSAYEYTAADGVRKGIFTDSLRLALEEAGSARVSWSTLVRRVRQRVMTLEVAQRPETEGPWSRALFSAEPAPADIALPVTVTRADRVMLPGAALLGVAPGDTFAITAAGVAEATEQTTVAHATVSSTDGVAVEADIKLCAGRTSLPSMAEAHPVATSAARDPVRVRGHGVLADSLRHQINLVPTLRAVGADHDGPVLADVTIGETVTLGDGGLVPLTTEPATEVGVARVVANLRRMARTAALRRLTPDRGTLDEKFVVEWGRVVGHKPEPLPSSGALVNVGDSVYVRLRNTGERSLYFFVFDIGVAYRVELISVETTGLLIRPGQEYTIGDRIDGSLVGTPLFWPPGLAIDGPRPETLLVLVTTEPHDLAAVAHDGVVVGAVRGSSPLQLELAAALGTTTRDWPRVRHAEYAVVHVDFDLNPEPVPQPETARFAIDQRPHPSARALAPRARTTTRSARPAARTVAVRVTDLVVHRNRALGGADVRIDTLVLTGGGRGDVTEMAKTAWFGRVRDRRSQALSELLRERLTDGAFQTAVQSLSVVSPPVGLAVSAVGAGAIIVNSAYELLSRAVPSTIGVYRTSFLATEDFGVGRHPTHGSFTVQDFSFAYEIVDAG